MARKLENVFKDLLDLAANNSLEWARYVQPHLQAIVDTALKQALGYTWERPYKDKHGNDRIELVYVAPDIRSQIFICNMAMLDPTKTANLVMTVRRAETLMAQAQVLPAQRENLIASAEFTRRTTLAFDRELVDNNDIVDMFFRVQGLTIGYLQGLDLNRFPTTEEAKEMFIARFTDAFEMARNEVLSDLPGQKGFLPPVDSTVINYSEETSH